MKFLLLAIALCTPLYVSGQRVFDMKRASKVYNVRLTVAKCDDTFCGGDATYEIYRKGSSSPFQTVRLKDVEFMLPEAAINNSKKRYDLQSTVFFEDYDFDGLADIALRDGNNSGYGGPSYQIYLYSSQKKAFVHSPELSDLNQNEYLGMMEVDRKKRVLRTSSKSGCCLHATMEFKVVNGRPKKVFSELEDAMQDEKRIVITTQTLVNGKWRSKTRYVKKPPR
jgi:hypothetical protein